jgi:hypothetical protein
MKWIPITEKFPQVYDKVWTATKSGYVTVNERITDTYHGADRLKFMWGQFPDIAEDPVTHWMEYIPPKPPEPPKHD